MFGIRGAVWRPGEWPVIDSKFPSLLVYNPTGRLVHYSRLGGACVTIGDIATDSYTGGRGLDVSGEAGKGQVVPWHELLVPDDERVGWIPAAWKQRRRPR